VRSAQGPIEFISPNVLNRGFAPQEAANMKTRSALCIATLVTSVCLSAPARASDSVAGALIGAGAGALVGQAIGGRDGAIVGGMLGAAAGVSAAAQRNDVVVGYATPHGYPAQTTAYTPVYGGGVTYYAPPAPAAYGYAPAPVYGYGYGYQVAPAPVVVYPNPPVVVIGGGRPGYWYGHGHRGHGWHGGYGWHRGHRH
jgi:hypothetical protein